MLTTSPVGQLTTSTHDYHTFHLNRQNLSIDFAEHDVQCTNDGDNVGQHVILADNVECRQMRKAGRLDLAAVRLRGAVRHQVHTEFTFGRFDGGVGSTRWHLITLREQFEVMDERLHGVLHLGA